MKIEITDADIDNGRAGHCTMCPIALSAKRHFPNWVDVSVDGEAIKIYDSGAVSIFDLPVEAMQFIARFDDKFPVFPFTFETL